MRKTAPIAACLIVLFTLTACESIFNSIYRETDLNEGGDPRHPGGRSLVTDAKQRVIINVAASTSKDDPNLRNRSRIICAEPSPDVAQAISAAVEVSASASKAGAGSGSGSFGLATAASVAQLGERLAVIQLLRDKMYRACEAYANGATTKAGYTLMLARLDKTMTTMLASEMAASAFGRNQAQIGGSASGSGVDPKDLAAAQQKVVDLQKKVSDAGDVVAAAKDDASRATALSDFKDKTGQLKEATQTLLAAEQKVSVAAASGASASNIGKIEGASSGGAMAVAAIHQNFMDDDGLEPMVDACITSLTEREYLPPKDKELEKASPRSSLKMLSTQTMVAISQPSSDKGKTEVGGENISAFDVFCLRNILTRSFVKDRMENKVKLRQAPAAGLNSASLAAVVGLCGPIFQAAVKGTPTGDVGQSFSLCNQMIRAQMLQTGAAVSNKTTQTGGGVPAPPKTSVRT